MFKKTMVLGLALLFLAGFTKNSEPRLYWMKIKAQDKFDRTAIANTGAVIESLQDDYVVVVGTLEEKNKLEEVSQIEVSFPLTQEMIDLDFPAKDSNFHNYEELLEAAKKIATEHPHIARVEDIGTSLEGRRVIDIVITKQTKESKAGIVFTGAHHAREHVSTEMPLMLAQHLVSEYANGNKEIIQLVDNREIHIMPMINPDGVEWDIRDGSYHWWRKNKRTNSDGKLGVDLNRNYGFKWGGSGSSGKTSSDTYRGPKPFSEPETQAVKNFIETHDNITTLLSFHTFSQLILYPWGHKYDSIQNDADRSVHETMANEMAKWNGYTPQTSAELYLVSGDTTDWAYGEHGLISFTFELDPKSMWDGGFYPGQDILPSVFDKNIQPCLYLIEYSDNPYRVLAPKHTQLGFSTPLF